MKEGSVDANSGKEGRRDPRNASYLHILDQDNFSQFYKKKRRTERQGIQSLISSYNVNLYVNAIDFNVNADVP